jgi:hypothetical protein
MADRRTTAVGFAQENRNLLGMQTYTRNIGQALSKLRAAESAIKANPSMSATDKRAQLDAIDARRQQMLEGVEQVRHRAYGT